MAGKEVQEIAPKRPILTALNSSRYQQQQQQPQHVDVFDGPKSTEVSRVLAALVSHTCRRRREQSSANGSRRKTAMMTLKLLTIYVNHKI